MPWIVPARTVQVWTAASVCPGLVSRLLASDVLPSIEYRFCVSRALILLAISSLVD